MQASTRSVFVADQLGALRLDTTKEVELCVPSLAELPSDMGGLAARPGDPQQLVSAATFDFSQAPGWTDAEVTIAAAASSSIGQRQAPSGFGSSPASRGWPARCCGGRAGQVWTTKLE